MMLRILALAAALAACRKKADGGQAMKPTEVVDFKTAMQALCDAYPETGVPTATDLAKRVNAALIAKPNPEVVRFVAALGERTAPDRARAFHEMVERAGIASCRTYDKATTPPSALVDGMRALCDAVPDATPDAELGATMRAALTAYSARADRIGDVVGLWQTLLEMRPGRADTGELHKWAAYAGVVPCKLEARLAKK